jgi:hypothetical protein
MGEPKMTLSKVTDLEFNRKDNGKPFVTAYNGVNAVYTHPLTTVAEFYEWAKALGAEKVNIAVANTADKVVPRKPDIYDVEKPVEPPVTNSSDYIPFATVIKGAMKQRVNKCPTFFIIHWTSGIPSTKGVDGITEGAKNGYTYLFLERTGKLFQGAPTNAGGYHAGVASVDSFDCLGVEVSCAGKVDKIGDLYVPWFAINSSGVINKERCIPADEIIYDADDTADDGSFKGYYQKFTYEQKKTLIKLALYSVQVLKIPVDNIRGHDEIARPVGRKCDPGNSIGPGGMVQFRKDIASLIDKGLKWTDV